jgi:hypothetical protein
MWLLEWSQYDKGIPFAAFLACVKKYQWPVGNVDKAKSAGMCVCMHVCECVCLYVLLGLSMRMHSVVSVILVGCLGACMEQLLLHAIPHDQASAQAPQSRKNATLSQDVLERAEKLRARMSHRPWQVNFSFAYPMCCSFAAKMLMSPKADLV